MEKEFLLGKAIGANTGKMCVVKVLPLTSRLKLSNGVTAAVSGNIIRT
jgi:hypothetical protein